MSTPKKHIKVLTIDIETSPNLADVWDLWNQNISLNQLHESSRVLCFASKWYDKKSVQFFSEYHNGHEDMILQAWELMDQCDILISYNGPAFDVKHLQREFMLADMPPPSPFKNVDLLRVVRAQFKFPSNRLDHVAQRLDIGAKLKHEGHALWTDCLAGDAKAWAKMKKYNMQDVYLTEELYDRLGPWIKDHPHVGLWTGEERCCFRCGSVNLKQDGLARTSLTAYAQFRCEDCGAWSRLNHRKGNVIMRTHK